ncbi:MAG TPA: type II secretion system protein GspM [Burkholderiaceae bacterium]|nr:type II secretion system protein GspM [Burkholderiaceae bacterium]
MFDQLIVRWQALQTRERRVIAVALALLLVVGTWLIAYEPAAAGRRQLAQELPQLRVQVAQMEAMAAEARRLSGAAATVLKPEQIREQIEQSIAAAGFKPHLAELKVSGDLIDARFAAVPFAAWLAWFDTALRETRMRPIDVSISRDNTPGIVNARVALEPPRSGR